MLIPFLKGCISLRSGLNFINHIKQIIPVYIAILCIFCQKVIIAYALSDIIYTGIWVHMAHELHIIFEFFNTFGYPWLFIKQLNPLIKGHIRFTQTVSGKIALWSVHNL